MIWDVRPKSFSKTLHILSFQIWICLLFLAKTRKCWASIKSINLTLQPQRQRCQRRKTEHELENYFVHKNKKKMDQHRGNPVLTQGHNKKGHYSDLKSSLYTHLTFHKHYLTQTDSTVGTSFPTCLLNACTCLQLWPLSKRFSVNGHALKEILCQQFKYRICCDA